MSIDHNYARGKLKLLLRDLSNYNAGEFWREMSRIASGATASIHAEGLKAERDAMADSNAQLKQQNEAQIRMNAKLMHERDALAAYVEQLADIAERVCSVAPEHLDHLGADAAFVLRNSPSTSLARRDAMQKVEVLEQTAKDFKESWPEHTGKYYWLVGASHRYRRQAEGH